MDTWNDRTYWKSHYVMHGEAHEIERHLSVWHFSSEAHSLELVCFVKKTYMPSVLMSPGSGGHGYVFVELGYELHRHGYNVFIMPKHGGCTVSTLVRRHRDALAYVIDSLNPRVGVYGEELGGCVVFYLALAPRSSAE